MIRAARLSVAAAVLALALAPPAGASLRFERCGSAGFSCARLSVPLDRSASVPGRVALFVKRLRSLRRPVRGATFFLAGGPGQSATMVMDLPRLRLISPAYRDRDLIVFDQRGTGRSGFLRCRPLANLRDEGADCAASLGPRRAFYTTRDSVEDIEAIRRELGVERIALYGTSYGTKVALGYALAYPAHVERLVLDSGEEADGPDPLNLVTFAAVPRALRALCRSGCHGATDDPVDDLARLVERLARRPLRGRVIDDNGKTRPARLTRAELFRVLLAGDTDPTWRAAVPSAVRAALRGDSAPILRLERRARGHQIESTPPSELSDAVFDATSCEEARLPWARTTPFAERPGQARSAAALVPDAAFRPFDRHTALKSQLLELCEWWPAAPAFPALGPGPLPDVPVLLLEGEEDLRTPLESALRVAAQFPRSHLLVVPATGHSVLGSDRSGCARRAFGRFFSGGSQPPGCPPVRREFPPLPLPPRSLREVPGLPGVPGLRGRAVVAVAQTVRDVEYQVAGPSATGGGLRGGSWTWFLGTLELERVAFVPGVRVSGRARAGRARLRITGPGTPDGKLLIRGRRFSGRLGGQRVRGRFPGRLPGSAAWVAQRRTRPISTAPSDGLSAWNR